MATSEMDYMGGTPYAVIKVDFSIPVGGSDVPICNLTDSSSGIITFTASTNTSTWSVDGQTVTKISGTATSIAYYVTNGVLYAQNQSTLYTTSYSGEIENVIIRVDDSNNVETLTITPATNVSLGVTHAFKYGKIVEVGLRISVAANFADGDTLVTINQAPKGYIYPIGYCLTPGQSNRTPVCFSVSTSSGKAVVATAFGDALASGKVALLCFTYTVA